LDAHLQRTASIALEKAGHRLARAESLLLSLNPRAVLERGYAIVRDGEGRVLRDAEHTAIGSDLDIQLARARLRGTVIEIKR
jgi:exodeoxyribonuclease VII large subunit